MGGLVILAAGWIAPAVVEAGVPPGTKCDRSALCNRTPRLDTEKAGSIEPRKGGADVRRRVWSILGVVSGATAGLVWMGSVGAEPSFDPAAPGEQPYVVDNISVVYPPPDGDYVDVSFDYAWAGETYPGPAECQLLLIDAGGEVVGVVDIELDSLEAAAAAHLGRVADIQAAGDPEEASVRCASARAPDPAGTYAFGALELVDIAGQGTYLQGTVNWTGSGPSDTHQCTLTVSLPSGEIDEARFTLSAPDGHPLHMWLPGLPSGGQDPVVRCATYGSGTQPRRSAG